LKNLFKKPDHLIFYIQMFLIIFLGFGSNYNKPKIMEIVENFLSVFVVAIGFIYIIALIIIYKNIKKIFQESFYNYSIALISIIGLFISIAPFLPNFLRVINLLIVLFIIYGLIILENKIPKYKIKKSFLLSFPPYIILGIGVLFKHFINDYLQWTILVLLFGIYFVVQYTLYREETTKLREEKDIAIANQDLISVLFSNIFIFILVPSIMMWLKIDIKLLQNYIALSSLYFIILLFLFLIRSILVSMGIKLSQALIIFLVVAIIIFLITKIDSKNWPIISSYLFGIGIFYRFVVNTSPNLKKILSKNNSKITIFIFLIALIIYIYTKNNLFIYSIMLKASIHVNASVSIIQIFYLMLLILGCFVFRIILEIGLISKYFQNLYKQDEIIEKNQEKCQILKEKISELEKSINSLELELKKYNFGTKNSNDLRAMLDTEIRNLNIKYKQLELLEKEAYNLF